jgi:membrane protease YdiL (CAAX protease family)
MAYFADTKRRSYAFLFSIILLVLYEGGLLVARALGGGQIVNGVDAWLDQLIAFVPHGTLILSGVLVLAGFTFVYLDKKQGVALRSGVFVGMFFESAVWAAGLFFLMPMFVFKLLSPEASWLAPALQVGGVPDQTLAEEIISSFGAGFYEEFFFRLLLVGILMLLVKLFRGDPKHPMPQFVIAIIAAILFSAVHYIGSLGDNFTFYSFIYRFLMGLLFSGLLLLRGFGITSWTHALYDVFVFTARSFTGG